MKNKKSIIFTAVFLIAFAVVVSAATVTYMKTIEVSTDINLSLNGQSFTPKDSSGNPVELFVYNGTTYVPIRAISEAFGCDVSYDGNTKTAIINEKGKSTIKADNLSFGDTFIFDELEITFYDEVEWGILDNKYSDFHGESYFTIPMTIKNISNETHGINNIYTKYLQYGTKGTNLSNIPVYSLNDDVIYAGDMRPGATLQVKMYFQYDGNGDYWVEFSEAFFSSTKVEVRLPIVKP